MSGLVVALTLAVLHVTFLAHVRAIAIDSAIEGAAFAALADTSDLDGVERTRNLLADGIAASLIHDVVLSSRDVHGVSLVTVRVTMGVPLIGPWLPVGEFEAIGRAVREEPRFAIPERN